MSAWSVIKYEGKRLDAYKLRWFRKQKKRLTSGSMGESATISSTITSNPITNDGPSTVTGISSTVTGIPSTVTGIPISSTVTGIPPVSLAGIANAMIIGPIPTKALDDDDPEKMMIRNMVNHEQLVGRHANNEQDMSILVKCVPFSALDRIQPFTMTISTNALLLIDFHCHLTSGEVTGYLGGTWDTSSHNLSILQGFPCRSRLADKDRSSAVEEEIRSNLESRNLSVVGWYHSHPRSAAHPSVKDIENQIEYQVIMKGETEANYVPCVGFISSPYDEYNPGPESCYQAFWIMPPPEYRPFEYGRPMQMLYTVTRDSFLTQDLLLEMVGFFLVFLVFWVFGFWNLVYIRHCLLIIFSFTLVFKWLMMQFSLLLRCCFVNSFSVLLLLVMITLSDLFRSSFSLISFLSSLSLSSSFFPSLFLSLSIFLFCVPERACFF